jgi:Fe2+ transport system protein B
MRYSAAERLVAETFKKGGDKLKTRTEKLDSVLTNKYLALPIFFLAMGLIFFLTFGIAGRGLGNALTDFMYSAAALFGQRLAVAGTHPVLVSFIIDGALSGVISVLSFLPMILTLFFFLPS